MWIINESGLKRLKFFVVILNSFQDLLILYVLRIPSFIRIELRDTDLAKAGQYDGYYLFRMDSSISLKRIFTVTVDKKKSSNAFLNFNLAF